MGGRLPMAGKKKEIEYRYYEIPQNEPCMALLGEAWVRPYGMDSLHFHNYMEIGFCYDGIGDMVLDEQTVPYKPDMITIIPKNFPHNTASDSFSLSSWEYLFIDVEAFLREVYREDSLYAGSWCDYQQPCMGGGCFAVPGDSGTDQKHYGRNAL